MNHILILAKLKRKKWGLRLALFRHRLEYWFHQKTDEALFGCLMLFMFLGQFLLYIASR